MRQVLIPFQVRRLAAMIRTSRMLSIKIPIAVMSQDQGDESVEIVILEPPKPASTLILGSQVLREKGKARQ